jgi:hypothetical protein
VGIFSEHGTNIPSRAAKYFERASSTETLLRYKLRFAIYPPVITEKYEPARLRLSSAPLYSNQ